MKPSTVAASLVIAASVFSYIASASVTIDWVTVGDAGNAADPQTGFGAVGYEYKIGKYEVTNAQYAEFLNAKAATDSNGLYNSDMADFGIAQSGSSGSFTYSVTGGMENRPVVLVSWFDAARMANWTGNGQGSGDTENGSYTLLGATSGIITVNTGAQVYIPTEDEWYKAAYYNGASSTYSYYPNGQNFSITTANANYDMSVGHSTDVGTYSSDPSMYGTFDQGGNVLEWNDAVIADLVRGLRGGSWNNYNTSLGSYTRDYDAPSDEYFYYGFRLASVPEPSSLVLTMLASGVVLIRRKR